ncbi:hypothetical protein HN51_064915, partial [Arachis hypogaea]
CGRASPGDKTSETTTRLITEESSARRQSSYNHTGSLDLSIDPLQDASDDKFRSISRSSFDYSLMMAGKTTVNAFRLRVLIGTIIFVVPIICQWRRRHMSSYESIEIFLQNNNNLEPIKYTYREIKMMTKNFKEKLGKGGFGS